MEKMIALLVLKASNLAPQGLTKTTSVYQGRELVGFKIRESLYYMIDEGLQFPPHFQRQRDKMLGTVISPAKLLEEVSGPLPRSGEYYYHASEHPRRKVPHGDIVLDPRWRVFQ